MDPEPGAGSAGAAPGVAGSAPSGWRPSPVGLALALCVVLVAGLAPFRRVPRFVDGLSGADISSRYALEHGWARIALEPVCGVAFEVVDREVSWLPAFALAYAALLVVRLARARRKGLEPRVALATDALLDRVLIRGGALGGFLLVVVGGGLALAGALRGRLVVEGVALRAGLWACRAILAVYAGVAIRETLRWRRTSRPGRPGSPDPGLVVSAPASASEPVAGGAPAGSRAPVRVRAGLVAALAGEAARAFGLLLALVAASFALAATPLPVARVRCVDPAERALGGAACPHRLLDLHLHTTLSDGYLAPAGRVRQSTRQGLDGAAISDHHHTRGAREAERAARAHALGFAVLRAQEYTSDDPFCHLVVIGPEEAILPARFAAEVGAERALAPREAIARAKALGGFVLAAHPYARARTATPSLADLRAWGVDGFETANGQMERYGVSLEPVRAFCRAEGALAVAGSDAHENGDLACFVRVLPAAGEPWSAAAALAALRAGPVEPVAIDHHPERWGSAERRGALGPFLRFLTYLRDLAPAPRAGWLCWTALALLARAGWSRRLRRRYYERSRNL